MQSPTLLTNLARERSANYLVSTGVYWGMARVLFLLFCCTALPAQMPAQRASEDPLAAPLRAVAAARQEGRFADVEAGRDSARQLLGQLPVDSPQFGYWVQSVAQLYQMSGRTAQSRAVLETALDRVDTLGAGRATRIQLLTAMAGSWQQERNLLRAVPFLEKAVSEWEAGPVEAWTPANSTPANSTPTTATKQGRVVVMSRLGGGPLSNGGIYQRLADLDRQLGRQDAAAAVVEKWRKLTATNRDTSLGSYFEQQGQIEEAAAVYREALTRTTEPFEESNILRSLAGLYERNDRSGDSIATIEQAIARLDGLGSPQARDQSANFRQNLARLLQQSGRVAQADAIYQELLTAAGPDQAFQLQLNFANYLASTKRAEQATMLLKQFQTNHPDLKPGEENSLLFGLANAARAAGDSTLAERYQSMAIAKQPRPPADPSSRVSMQEFFQKAQVALNAGKLDEAFALASEAMDVAPLAADREQMAWQVPALAAGFARHKATGQADQLYQRVFALVESWSPDTLQPLLNVSQNYPRFLMGERRWAEVPPAIDRYRSLLMTAHGAESGSLADPIHMTIESEVGRGLPSLALLPAQDLLALEESLSGTTSAPYLEALRAVANVYEQNSEREHVVSTRRRMVEIADRIFPAKSIGRASARLEVAFTLAGQGQFDEAERLAGEAAEITRDGKSGVQYARSLEQIRQQRTASLKGGPPGVPVVQRDFIMSHGAGQWFNPSTVVLQNDGSVVGTPIRK